MKSNKVWMIRLTGGNKGGRASDTLAYTEHKYDQESVLTRQCKARTNIGTHVQLSCFGIKMSNIRPALLPTHYYQLESLSYYRNHHQQLLISNI